MGEVVVRDRVVVVRDLGDESLERVWTDLGLGEGVLHHHRAGQIDQLLTGAVQRVDILLGSFGDLAVGERDDFDHFEDGGIVSAILLLGLGDEPLVI